MPRIHKVHTHAAALTALLMFGAGCFGAVSTTSRQLQQEALSPITVPIEQGLKAKKTLEDVNARQEQMNAAIEAAGE